MIDDSDDGSVHRRTSTAQRRDRRAPLDDQEDGVADAGLHRVNRENCSAFRTERFNQQELGPVELGVLPSRYDVADHPPQTHGYRLRRRGACFGAVTNQ